MRFVARGAVHRKNERESEARLHGTDGLAEKTDTRVAEQRGVAGIGFVQLRFARKFKHRGELKDAGHRQLPVRNGIPENETVFKILHAALAIGTKERGI